MCGDGEGKGDQRKKAERFFLTQCRLQRVCSGCSAADNLLRSKF